MADLILHPQTQQAITSLINSRPHAVLLSGRQGSGKRSLAELIASNLLSVDQKRLPDHPYYKLVEPVTGKAITIEAVRELSHFLSLKTPTSNGISRLIVINDAHVLTIEAQNALLKTLEEPPADTMLMLTSSHDQALLPTIRSRVQTLNVLKPGIAELASYFSDTGYNDAAINQALAISGGLPGLAQALLSNDQDHPMFAAAQTARAILQDSSYNRLTMVDGLSKDKTAAEAVMAVMEQMAHTALLTGTPATAKRWQRVLTASYEAQEALASNGQTKLVLTNLMLSL